MDYQLERVAARVSNVGISALRWVRGHCLVLAGIVFAAFAACQAEAQTNTIGGVTTELTTGLGSAEDTAITLGIVITGIGFVVYLIRKGIHLRG